MEEEHKQLYEMKSIKIGDILYLEVAGKRMKETMWKIAQRTVELCKVQNIHLLFIDCRKLKGLINTTGIFSLGTNCFQELQWNSTIYKTAVIDNDDYPDECKFFENIVHNRGFQLHFFDSIIDALKWLKVDSVD